MPISKYDKFPEYDWRFQSPNIVQPQIDLQGLEETLATQQAQVDQLGMISDKNPQVLNTDADQKLYQEYRTGVDAGLTNVATAYQQGVNQGNKAYRDYLNSIKKDWLPAGKADVLNKRYQGYQTALKEIDEFYKTDPNPVNKTLAIQNLKVQLGQDIGFDAEKRTYNSITTPELYKNPDIRKAIDEMLKGIEADETTNFLGNTNSDWWIQKIKTETRPAEKIKLAYQALSEQPEFASQINRDTQYQKLFVDPKDYKDKYSEQVTNQLGQLESASKEAAKSKSGTTEWQNYLRQQGYNVTPDGDFGNLTKKATQEFLDAKKLESKSKLDNFNFDQAIRSDVDKSYLGYATRGAYTKVDKDLILNGAKKAMLQASMKGKEIQASIDIASGKYSPNKASDITVVSSIAQQLPEINKFYEDTKKTRDQVKSTLDQTLAKTSTFQGWKMEDVSEAYLVWNKAVSQLPAGASEQQKIQAYKSALNQNSSSYQFTDQDVSKLYTEMSAPKSENSVDVLLNAYSTSNEEVQRLEDGQTHLAAQYINTPEGKAAIQRLRNTSSPSLKSLTDEELVRQAFSQPDQFLAPVTTTPQDEAGLYSPSSSRRNTADEFKSTMKSDLVKQTKAGLTYDWGSLGTNEIWAGKSDNYLRPVLDNFAQAIETGSGNNFSTFGKTGLTFKTNKGVDITDGETKKVIGMAPAKNEKGKPILRVNVAVTDSDGKSKDGYTEIDVIPGSAEQRQLITALEASYADLVNSGNKVAAQGVLDNLHALQGNNGVNAAAMDLVTGKLTLNNTKDEGLQFIDESGQRQPISMRDWQSKDLNDDYTINTPDGHSITYKTYGINTPTGNYTANVFEQPLYGVDNQIIGTNKVLVPNSSGSLLYSSSSGIAKERLGKQVLATTPVEITKTKIKK